MVNRSQQLFAEYLSEAQCVFEQDFSVWNERNVDFYIRSPELLCDVKEIRPRKRTDSLIDHDVAIKRDLQKLRRKFGDSRPRLPILLITMNMSGMFFTGFTVATAMLGKVGTEVGETHRTQFHHLREGDAAMTLRHLTAISGVLVFDCAAHLHCLFSNPFAINPVPKLDWPNLSRVDLDRNWSESDLTGLGKRTFWPCDP